MRVSKIAKRSDQWLTRHSAMEDVRFRFGENWLQFARNLKEPQIHEAVRSLQDLLNVNDLSGKSFLDIGSGSGLFSLAAHRLGADVHSFDYDLQSVESTKILRDKYRSVSAKWVVERGSILSPEYLSQLGSFDVVYSWGYSIIPVR
jgi:2-polyprenyl-3-methyl-5-hydroxy-6-metoxy-1,4-benzoquinol methylase